MKKPILFAVDDDPQVLRSIVRDLRSKYRKEYRIISTESANEALEAQVELKKKGEEIAAFISDQRMPEMLGVDYLELAKANFPAAKRVLLMNGIHIPDGIGVSAQEAPDTAAAIGFPVVVKAVRADLLHKTEAGAVAVGLESGPAVAEAVAAMGCEVTSNMTSLVVLNLPGVLARSSRRRRFRKYIRDQFPLVIR